MPDSNIKGTHFLMRSTAGLQVRGGLLLGRLMSAQRAQTLAEIQLPREQHHKYYK
jgi:hypothetical protein